MWLNQGNNTNNHYILISIVCLDIQLNIYVEKDDVYQHNGLFLPGWKLGSCSSSELDSLEKKTYYKYSGAITERCCLEPGMHILKCYSSPPAHGWRDTYLRIDGQRYCDDFVGYESYQKINFTSTQF